MERQERITAGITKQASGIEIAPWFAPLAAKRDGYNVRIIDIFDRNTLLDRAREDPKISPQSYHLIEEVDFVGSATELTTLIPAELHGTFDYIVSSHNFEHVPNPIKFLQSCQQILKPGGLISMAVPDARACFDYFRPHTSVGDWIDAYLEDRQKPTLRQVFNLASANAVARFKDQDLSAFWIEVPLESVQTIGNLKTAFQAWQYGAKADEYQDTHCTVMSPASLELMLIECNYLELTSLEIESISKPVGCEFYVRLRNRPATLPAGEINDVRTALMRRIWAERALRPDAAETAGTAAQQPGASNVSYLADKLFGKKIGNRLTGWRPYRSKRRNVK